MSKKIMVFSAHTADFCSRSGGTIAKAVEHGCQVRVVIGTFGERGESSKAWTIRPVPSVQTVKEIRRKEAEAVARILGCTMEFLDFDDNPLYLTPERKAQLFQLICDFAPDIIFTHWRIETLNPDHGLFADAVVEACHYLRCAGKFPGKDLIKYPTIYFFEPTVPYTDMVDFKPNFYVDVSEVWPKKIKALESLASQPDLVRDYTLYGQYRGFQAKGIAGGLEVKYAEAFARFQPIMADPWETPH
jgi:4-oxalomesaconate hydratase